MKRFSHIYIEEEAFGHKNTKLILEKYPAAKVITINSYKNIFNRNNQNFQAQKSSPKLILAVKKDNFLYKGSPLCSSFGNDNFYYNAMILNCSYNCDYCYLQGMFKSGNIVVFVNEEDFFSETEKFLSTSSLYLCISYDTDLLALESLIPYCSNWIDFCSKKENLKIEIRTKSNNYKNISHLQPNKNVILAWSISPEEVIKKYEKKTPTLNRRIESIQQALNDNWNVRICFDPILHIQNWEKIYLNMIEYVFSKIDYHKIFEISIGTFRINNEYLKNIKKMRSDSDLLYYPFVLDKTNTYKMYPENIQNKIINTINSEILKYLPEEKIFS